jgi:hypothetical protein
MKGTIEVLIQDEYQVFVAKLKHDNYYNPIELIVFKNTIGDVTASVGEMGEYELTSDGLFPPDRTWIAKPICSSGKHLNGHCTAANTIEIYTQNGVDLNGYMDIEIRIYP